MATKTNEIEQVSVAKPEWDAQAVLAQLDLSKLIQDQVNAALAQASHNTSNPVVEAEQRGQRAVAPPKYLKHYRCDVSPELHIARRVYNPETDALDQALKGKYIKFRRGHYFATDQDEVDQIEWMMRHPSSDPANPERIIGGNPTIYEDDGRDLIGCPHCGEPFVAGSNAFRSHLRATHGVAV